MTYTERAQGGKEKKGEEVNMGDWHKPTIILCTYGFFKEMKPSESFLSPYLKGPDKNISSKALSDEIYPVSTYSYLLFLLLVLLTTDILRYKPLIIIESIAYLATRVMLIWGNGVLVMQFMQITYGLASATEIAYYSYIYAMVEENHYRKVTSYTRLFVLLGKGIGDILGQLLISTKVTNYLGLNYVSFGSVSIAVLVSLFLPRVDGSILHVESLNNSFQRFSNESDENIDSETATRNLEDEENNENGPTSHEKAGIHDNNVSTKNDGCCCSEACLLLRLYFRRLFAVFRISYSNTRLLKWSIWWAFAMCGGLQVEDYAMNLWMDLQQTNDVYNGAVFAMGTLISAFCVFLFSLTKLQWGVLSEFVIGAISVLDFVLLLTSAYTKNIWVAYLCYILFRALFAFALTVAR